MNNPTTGNEQKESGLSWRKFLRSKILNSDCNVIRDNPWFLELGYDIRDDDVKDVLTATKGNMTKLSKGDISKFRMRYRNRKKLTAESIYLRPRWIHSQGENTLTIQWPKTKHEASYDLLYWSMEGAYLYGLSRDANEHK